MEGIFAIDLIMTGINIIVLNSDLDEGEAYKKINKLR